MDNWHHVVVGDDLELEVDYVYDETVNKLIKGLKELEEQAFKTKDVDFIERIRKQKFSIMSNAIPRIIIKEKN